MKHEASIDENFRSLVVGEQKVVDVAIENGNIVYTWSPQWDAWNDLQHSKEQRLPKDRAAPVLSKGKKRIDFKVSAQYRKCNARDFCTV